MPRILVVDDDLLVRQTIEANLERAGFEVTIADGGEAGMRALEASTFDVMLVDIFMPHMRGFESVRIFHERAPATPLIVRTLNGLWMVFPTPISVALARMTLPAQLLLPLKLSRAPPSGALAVATAALT